MIYIEPNLKVHTNLKELLESKESILFFEPNITINDLKKKQKIFLVSEPGYGKTRLLKEHLLKNDNAGIFLDLKKIGNQDIEQYIKSTNFQNIKSKEYDENINKAKLFKTNDFQLQGDLQLIFCFDALDEVKNENFSEVVENIKKFIEKYKQSSFLISCRKNYLNKWQRLFSEINFDYIEIFPLNALKIKEFLRCFNINEDQVDELLEKLEFQNRKPIIQTPRYLEMIAELAKKEGVDKLKNISRGELFEKFIYKKLNIESEKTNNINNREIVKKVLEKLALVMEIYQSNQITKDELMEFFDDTKSNLNISFLNQVSINSFYERSLLKDNIDSIEFENTEFQEYLAAKEIMRLGRVEQVSFDLAVVPELEEICPSWMNTLSFVIESDINLLKTFFEYIFSNDNIVHTEDHIKLLTKHNVEKLKTEDRRAIFKMVYSFYQDTGHWIDYDIAEKLSFYYDDSLYEYIEKYFTNRKIKGEIKKVIKTNSATSIAFLIERELLNQSQKDKWKKCFKKLLNEQDQHETILRRTLFAIGKFKEINLFTKQIVNKIFQTREDIIITSLIHALEDIDSNSPIAYNCFLKGVKINNIPARHALYKVSNKESIEQILEKFAEDEELLHEFIEHESVYLNGDNEFIKNIQKVTDKVIIRKLKKIVIKAFASSFWYISRNSHFIKEIVLLIDKYSPNYIFELTKNCTDDKTLYNFENIFSILLKKNDIQKFIKEIEKIDNDSSRTVFRVLQKIKYSKRTDNEEIYEFGRQYFKQEYKQSENRQAQSDNEQKKQETRIYDDFRFILESTKNRYNVFQFYVNNKDQLEKFITPEDKERIGKLIKESIFDKFDPGEQKLIINKRVNGSTNYTTHGLVSVFGSCILIAKEFGLDISLYRQKILNYIPFAYDSHCDAIFILIPNPTDEELENVLNIYKNRTDDLNIFMPSSIIDFCEKYKVTKSILFLKKFVDSKQISLNERKNSLNAIAQVSEDGKKYFQAIFNKYDAKKSEDKELAEKANGILISKFKDRSAIKWRFKQLISRAFPFQRLEGVHSIGKDEHELSSKEFAQPLIQLKDMEYKEHFLKLLKDSFKIIKKSDNYLEYTSYIWSIIIEYFKNLKEIRSYEVLDDLDKFITENRKQKGMNWFCYQYQQLKLEYLIYIGKPLDISDCIKRYNFFKKNQYLEIATPRDLFELVQNTINTKMEKWWNSEGGLEFVKRCGQSNGQKIRQDEDLIQKTIKPNLEVALRDSGLKKEGLNIQRESQLQNNNRTDFLIFYGFIGPILIEIKLLSNPQARESTKDGKEYKVKLKSYIDGTKSHFGIFLVFEIDERYTKEKYLSKLQKLYSQEKNIKVIGL